MAQATDMPIAFRPLYDGPLVRVSDYRCRALRGGPTADEQAGASSVVFLRHGALCKHVGRRCVTADVNETVFFSAGMTYRVSHPADCGDVGTVFTPSPGVFREIIRALDPSIDERPGRPFPFVTGPCDPDLFRRHLGFVQRTERAHSAPVEPLWAEVTALQLVAGACSTAYARHGQPRPHRRRGTETDHAERTEAAKAYLAQRLGERVTLAEVARAVHASPFHFARVFEARTGLPLHRYLRRLRLRASLELLAAGAGDLTGLALELGFSSHSHFTDSFRREFGRTPSDFRRAATHSLLRQMSKNLKA